MRLLSPLILLFFLATACSSHREVPSSIISTQEMTGLLWDMIRADQFVSIFVSKDSSVNKGEASEKLYTEIFRIHHTNKEQFAKSLRFYKTNPDLFKPVLDSLDSRKKKFLEEAYKPSVPDSLKHSKGSAVE